MPKHVTTFKVLFRFSPKAPSATFVKPAYVETSDSDAALLFTTTSCAATNIRKVSMDNTSEDNKHAVTNTVPPCANAHGKAKPPAPKIDFIVFTTAEFSPDASAASAADAVAEGTTSLFFALFSLLLSPLLNIFIFCCACR